MYDRSSEVRAGRLIDVMNLRCHNDNPPSRVALAGQGATACGQLRIEADGQISEFLIPTDDEIDLMVLISQISANADESEALAEPRRLYWLAVWVTLACAGIIATALTLL